MTIYTVVAGDTLASIAAAFGITPALLAENNGLDLQTPLVVGQSLVVLLPAETYTVVEGDSIYGIARRYGTSVIQLYRNNPGLQGLPALEVGRELVIRYQEEPQNPLDVNAYAYPYIQTSLLRQTLPYLTYFTPFTYGFTPEGELVPLDDQVMVDLALEYGVTPWMHLSTLTPQGVFSSELGLSLLGNIDAQERLIGEIITNMQEKNYQGLDVDFEFIGLAGAAPYADFVNRLRERLSPLGYEVVVALAPKVRDGQPGSLYEGHDYGALGAAADGVLLMTYEWGYTYGPPLAVAPIPSVRQVLDYAVTKIPPNKIFLGIPAYGYDWSLPYERGVTKAQSLSNVEAVALARRYGAEILYDTVAQAPHFNYTDEQGVAHEVWFEDARSIDAKLNLIEEYGFRGAGYWNLMRPFPSNWSLLNSRYRITS
ncbi:MAG: LysM peptidoglycan-binding domain-containing protein [Clostridia bacterium]|nr:LysM peptidoglycan-binding domain-containing protein [Clostridia bacterium]